MSLATSYDVLVALIAGWLTFAISLTGSRLLAQSKFLLDQPNARSNHVRTTPRSGGIAIFLGFAAGLFVLAFFAEIGGAGPLVGFVGLVAAALLLGVVDDRVQLRPLVKLGGQILIAFGYVWAFAPLAEVPLPFWGVVELGALGPWVTVFWIVGFMNAYNFMDGANGLASGSAAIGLCALAAIASAMGAIFVAVVAVFCAAALLGFFQNNFISGQIFMGDGGSLSIGFVISALAVHLASQVGGSVVVLVVPMIFLCFLVDVAFTLVHRWLRHQPLRQAHSEHVYQLLIRMGAEHTVVGMVYFGLMALGGVLALVMIRWPAAAQPWFVIGYGAVLLIAGVRVFYRARRAGVVLLGGNHRLDPSLVRETKARIEARDARQRRARGSAVSAVQSDDKSKDSAAKSANAASRKAHIHKSPQKQSSKLGLSLKPAKASSTMKGESAPIASGKPSDMLK